MSTLAIALGAYVVIAIATCGLAFVSAHVAKFINLNDPNDKVRVAIWLTLLSAIWPISVPFLLYLNWDDIVRNTLDRT